MTTETQTLSTTSRTSAIRWRRFALFFVGTLLALLVVGAIGTYLYASSSAGHILSGVNIGGVSVAGLTPEAAKAKLLTALPDVANAAATAKLSTREFRQSLGL